MAIDTVKANTATCCYEAASELFVASAVEVVADRSPAPQITDIHDVIVKAVAERVFAQIDALSSLRDNWDGYGAPAPSSKSIWRTIDAIDHVPSFPIDIVPSAEGGAAIHLRREGKNAQLEFLNDGDIIGLTYSREDAPHAWQLTIDDVPEAFSQIHRYLTG